MAVVGATAKFNSPPNFYTVYTSRCFVIKTMLYCKAMNDSLPVFSAPLKKELPNTVVAPPVEACYNCGCGLVAAMSNCIPLVYTVSGVVQAQMFTLHCHILPSRVTKTRVDFDFILLNGHILKRQILYCSCGMLAFQCNLA